MTAHRWKFIWLGGSRQVALNTPADIENLPELPNQYWAALSAPVAQLALDPVALRLLDSNADGLISAQEVRDGLRWTLQHLKARALLTPLAGIPVADFISPAMVAAAQSVMEELHSRAPLTLNALLAAKAKLPHTNLEELEKLLRLQAIFLPLLRCFVNFADFYANPTFPLFNTGTLTIDSHTCRLCLPLNSVEEHLPLGHLSRCSLLYCTLTLGANTRRIVAILSQGTTTYLAPGRHGLFVDLEGQSWQATLTHLVEQPTSIRAAFLSPYLKFIRLIEEQLNPKLTGKPSPSKGIDVGTVGAVGIALGSIGTLIGGFATGFIGFDWMLPLWLLGIILGISLPSMAIAAHKLAQRSLAPLLDACGWTINARLKLDLLMGHKLTQITDPTV